MAGIMRILIGLPASGKSTYCRDLMNREPFRWVRISWDDIRHETPNYKFNRQNETRVIEQSFATARFAVAEGYELLIDNTNLNFSHQGRWSDLAEELSMKVETKRFDTSVEECVRRDTLRKGAYAEGGSRVGRIVIERMALANGLISFPTDRQIVIVDVDGTLADNKHRTHRVEKTCQTCKGVVRTACGKCNGTGKVDGTDWKTFFRPELILADPPRYPVAEWVRELYDYYTVLIVSGRPDNLAGEATVSWLAKNEIPYHHIFMRNGSDKRDDVLVKADILKQLPEHRIAFCIDDRNRVVDMWREKGLHCYQVVSREEGDF